MSPSVRRRLPLVLLSSLVLVAVPAAVAGGSGNGRGIQEPAGRTERPDFDRRAGAARAIRPNAAQVALQRSLGPQGVVQLDPRTGTPRVLARLDGFLTGPSRKDAADAVLDYVRAHPDVFQLDEDDLAGLRVTRDYTDVAGVRHLIWAQTYRGIPAFENDLRASVTSDGRIVNVMGSPQPDLRAATTTPSVSAGGALAAALRNVGRPGREPRVVAPGRGAARATSFAGGHRANLVLVNDGSGMRLAWHVTAHADSDEVYTSLVDASSGEVLRRANKVEDAQAKVWDYYPTAAAGGGATVRPIPSAWLPSSATTLNGPNVHAFLDLDDDNKATTLPRYGSEEVAPRIVDWDYTFAPFSNPSSLCSPSTCSWDSYDSGDTLNFPSWHDNRKQNATQVFWFVNTFHDHLKNDPSIGFNSTSGNFEGIDKLLANSDDGANTGTASSFLGPNMPDDGHLNNANMFTPPNDTSPTMQMYLFTSTTGNFASDPTPDVNGGDDASVVYHEYTHGLSNRLITYSNGWGALDSPQSGAMGEAWSDWYAMDYLVAKGFAPDNPAEGDVLLDRYIGNGVEHTFRSEGLDCPVGASPADCPGPGTAGTAGSGGYTYGDFGRVFSGPEVHADGEIWGQTLWNLRSTLLAADPPNGISDTRFLITEGMRLSPINPSFLDMRNAILEANEVGVLNGRADHAEHIWDVFAARGMGYFASSVFGYDGDVTPVEDFSSPPNPTQIGRVTGLVINKDTLKPVAGVYVALAGHDSGFLGDLAAVTNSTGRYTITNVPAGDYPELYAFKVGWDEVIVNPTAVTAGATTTVSTMRLRRDWASSLAGGTIASHTGSNNAPFCGTNWGGAIDQALATGWPSDFFQTATPTIVVKLPAYVDMTAFAVDPGPTCSDPPNAGLRDYTLQVSRTGSSWTTAKSGSFSTSQQGRLNTVAVARRIGVRYVRLTMRSNFNNPDGFIDLSEVEIYGTPTPFCLGLPATKVGTNAGQTINGTAGADVIVGLGGNDRIDGRGGRDAICGGDGADTLIGGTGVDKFDGGAGNDTIFSRDGNKELTIRGGTGTDRARKDKTDRTSSVERFF